MRDYILLYINGKRHCLRGIDALLPLSAFLRERLGLTGTKTACGEGACGSCTVLVSEPVVEGEAELRYESRVSCLHRLFQLDGRHVLTVEGVAGDREKLTPVPKALADCHGTQCGFCTPGFVMSLTAFHAQGFGSVREALAGNLCRCTGYLPILEAGECLTALPVSSLAERYPPASLLADFVQSASESVSLDDLPVLHARTLDDALAFLARFPLARIVAGGTGTLLPANLDDRPILSLGAIPELALIEPRGDSLFFGANISWKQLYPVAEMYLPELATLLRRFGSPQIRHQGTVGGSVAQADGNSDWFPLLLVQEAKIHLKSTLGEREIPFADFLRERCAPGELVTGVSLPLPAPDERLRLFKVTRRQAFDRSVFCAAVCLRLAADTGTIAEARVACGGVGSVPVRLPQTEAFLLGQPYDEATMRRAGEIAAGEVNPETDAYASADYRRHLLARLLLRFYAEEGDVA